MGSSTKKRIIGASGRRSVLTMWLHKSDKKYKTMIENTYCMSGFEINISLSLSQPEDAQERLFEFRIVLSVENLQS